MAGDLMWRSPTELAELVRSSEVTARELVEESFGRIEALEPAINAFTALDADRALATADSISADDPRPFAGVPIATKDLNAVAGIRLSMGSDLFADNVPDRDDHLVRRIRDAGFVIVGVTSTPEFGILPVTEPRRFGPTRNPWDMDRTPGGSSGGAGAAVASGMVPVAHGSDGGGSIRIPAACCGLVGLKPSRGRVSLGPAIGDHVTSVHGSLTHTVADTAAMLDVLAGYEVGDSTWAAAPEAPFAELARREPGRLRIGWTIEPPIDAAVDPVCAGAVTEAAALLESLGHEVEEVSLPWRDPALLPLFTVVFATSNAWDVLLGGQIAGREPTAEDVEPLSWELYQAMSNTSAVQYFDARAKLSELARGLVGATTGYDVILTPSLAERPVPIGEIDSCAPDPMASFARSAGFTPFTAAWNITGQPAISLPLFHGDDGLPLGVQLAGPPEGEGLLLALATQLEEARPWSDRRPPLAG